MCSFELWSLCIQHTYITVQFTIIEFLLSLLGRELIHPSVLCPILMKFKTRRSLAAALVNELVDTETRRNSNVRGRGKDPLDPKIIAYVKKKCFKLHPSDKESDMKKDWEDCIISIDDKGRELKRKLKKQQQ